MDDLRYPVGPFAPPEETSAADRARFIGEIESAPALMARAVDGLGPRQLDTPYRDGGWTLRQVVHHLPDSHVNAYVRFRLALTEDEPTIKPYLESRWAELPDSRTAPVEVSLGLLEALHRRWILTLRAIEADQWTRTFRHPERGPMSLDRALAMYAWHGRHHAAHVTSLRRRMGWD